MKSLILILLFSTSFAYSRAQMLGPIHIQDVKLISTFFNPNPTSPFDPSAEAKFAITAIGSCHESTPLQIVDVSSISDTSNSEIQETTYAVTQKMSSGPSGGCEQTVILTFQRALDSHNLRLAKLTLRNPNSKSFHFILQVENNQLNVYDDNGIVRVKP